MDVIEVSLWLTSKSPSTMSLRPLSELYGEIQQSVNGLSLGRLGVVNYSMTQDFDHQIVSLKAKLICLPDFDLMGKSRQTQSANSTLSGNGKK